MCRDENCKHACLLITTAHSLDMKIMVLTLSELGPLDVGDDRRRQIKTLKEEPLKICEIIDIAVRGPDRFAFSSIQQPIQAIRLAAGCKWQTRKDDADSAGLGTKMLLMADGLLRA